MEQSANHVQFQEAHLRQEDQNCNPITDLPDSIMAHHLATDSQYFTVVLPLEGRVAGAIITVEQIMCSTAQSININ